jgi:hypothetical protein
VLGGSAGTTYDAFRLIHDAQKHGARVALFGRKINNAEHQLAFIAMLRLIVTGRIGPEEAVRAYHGILDRLGLPAKRPLDQDLQLTDPAMSYGGGATRTSVEVRNNPLAKPASTARAIPAPTPPAVEPQVQDKPAPAAPGNPAWPVFPDGSPDFSRMTPAERRAFDVDRLRRRFG